MFRKWDGIVFVECVVEFGFILRLNKNLEWEEVYEFIYIDIDISMMLIYLVLI